MLIKDFIHTINRDFLSQTTTSQESILSYMNLGLTVIHEKFSLSNKNTIINVLANTNNYALPSDFMSVDFIKTQGKYFRDQQGVLVTNVLDDFIVPINTSDDKNSVYINNASVFTVIYPEVNQTYIIDYKSSPLIVDSSMLNSILNISAQYILPLMLYVTYLGFMSNSGGTTLDTNTYLNRFTEACDTILKTGNYITRYGFNNKFNERGFV